MLLIPIRPGTAITGTPEQFARLAIYLRKRTTHAPDPARLVRLQLWDGQVVIASYAELHALADVIAARTATAPARARYTPPATINAAAGAVPFIFPAQVDLVTQTLNARGTTGGLRLPASAEAQPGNPASLYLSLAPQPYVAQVCTADLAVPGGWAASGPAYSAQAGHILVAAVRIAVAHQLLLAADQLLAVRWLRSTTWDCYLPAALINAWALHLAGHLAIRPADHATVRLPDPAR
jgi:hypothetical protein